MKAKDLRDRTTEDLAELERSLLGDRFQNRFKNFTNRLDDTSVIQKNKRDLARVKFLLAERAKPGAAPVAIAAASAPAAAKPAAEKPAAKAKKTPIAKAAGDEKTAAKKPAAKKTSAAKATADEAKK